MTELVYMRPELNLNRFEISLRGKILLRCMVTYYQRSHDFRRCETHFREFDRGEISSRSEFSMSTVNARNEIKLRRIIEVNNKCAIALLCSVARISAKIWDGEVYNNSKGLELLTIVAKLSTLACFIFLRSYEAVTIYCLQTSAIKLFAEKVGRFYLIHVWKGP